jgi:hypothetical protein
VSVNCSKSCMCLKQSGPHGAPSDNIISFPVNCGFPEGITLLTCIPTWVSQTECKQFMLGQKVLRLDVNLCLKLSGSGAWLSSRSSRVASNLEAPGQWTTSLWDSSHCSPVLCETRNLLRIFKLSISFVSTPCMACSLLAVSIWIISTSGSNGVSHSKSSNLAWYA